MIAGDDNALRSGVSAVVALTTPDVPKPKPPCFRPTEIVFADSDFKAPYNIDLDLIQSGMLDGRTIHFHFQFVEPELLESCPEAADDEQGSLAGAFSPRKVARKHLAQTAGMEEAEIRTDGGAAYSLYCLSRNRHALHAVAEVALAELARAGLDWVPQLSIGLFTDMSCPTEDIPHHARLAPDWAPQDAALNVLLQSAHWLASMWVRAEATRGSHDHVLVERAASFATTQLPRLMAAEYCVRVGVSAEEAVQSVLCEDILADFPLTRHLINFWDRKWNRQAFLSGSDFDYAPSLAALYDGWRA